MRDLVEIQQDFQRPHYGWLVVNDENRQLQSIHRPILDGPGRHLGRHTSSSHRRSQCSHDSGGPENKGASDQ